MDRVRCVVAWAGALAIFAASGRPSRAGEDDLAIRVIDAESGFAVAEMEVLVVLDGPDVPEKLRAPTSNRATTDRVGRAVLAGAAAARDVRVRAGELSGRAIRDTAAPEAIVFVAPVNSTIVQVVDANGVPRAGVPVDAWGPALSRRVLEPTRGEHGLLVIRHDSAVAQQFGIGVRVDLPFGRSVAAGGEPVDSAGPTLVRVRLPEIATVHVNADGLGETGGLARLRDARLSLESAAGGAWEKRLEGGQATFEFVPPGARVLVEVVPDDPARPVAREVVTAPAPDESAWASVRVGRLRATLAGRLFGPDGSRAGDRRVRVSLEPPAPRKPEPWLWRVSAEASTAADGRFTIRLDRDVDEVAGMRAVVDEIEKDPVIAHVTVVGLGATNAPAARDDGTVDLGRFPAAPSAELVEGTVHGDDGEPLDAASVSVQRRTCGVWSYVWRGSVACGGGRFGVVRRVGTDPVELRLVAHAPGRYMDAPVEFARGATDVRVVLRPAARFLLVADLPEGAATRDFEVVVGGEPARVASADGTDPPRRIAHGHPRGAQRVVFLDDLRPGDADVSVRWRGVTVWGPKPFDFRAGEMTEVGADIDVPSLLRTAHVTVRRPDGSPAAGAEVWTRPTGVRFLWTRATAGEDGRVSVHAAPGPLDVVVHHGDTSTGAVFAVAGDAEVVLRAAIPRTVRVGWALGGIAEPPSSVSIALTLAWVGPPGTPFEPATHTPSPAPGLEFVDAGPAGTATMTVLQPGVYAVVARASAHGTSGGFTRILSHAGPATLVEVAASGESELRAVYVLGFDEWVRLGHDAADL